MLDTSCSLFVWGHYDHYFFTSAGMDKAKDQPPSPEDVENEELERLQPTWEENRWLHVIGLFFLVGALAIGLPLWWWTTSPEQQALPIEDIDLISKHAINIGVDVSLCSKLVINQYTYSTALFMFVPEFTTFVWRPSLTLVCLKALGRYPADASNYFT